MPDQWADKIFNVRATGFDVLALEIFQFQYENNPLYKAYADMLGRDPGNVKAVSAVQSEPVIKGDAVTTRASEPTPSPPKPVASPTPTPSPSAPPSSAASPAASKSTPPASETTKTSQSQTAKPIRDIPFNAGVINGKAISLSKPQYPPNARTMRAEGLVTVEVLLDEEGKVISAKAVDGNAVLRQAAINAARLARFSPTLLAGQPVKVTGVITYKFSLGN